MNPQPKKFHIPGDQIKQLIPYMGACYGSDRITVDGLKVGYMYREAPSSKVDCGWRFFSGDESDEYANTADNWGIYDVNTICNYDPAIIPYLNAPGGTAFGRDPNADSFTEEPLPPTDG